MREETQLMAEADRSLGSLIWQLKIWWMVPIGLMVVLFALLLVFADASGDSPFIYTLF
jgi:Family of unknown function (DUF5989)